MKKLMLEMSVRPIWKNAVRGTRTKRMIGSYAKFLLVAAVVGVLMLAPAMAATLNVCGKCTYTTIQSAVDAAKTGDIILVHPGTYTGDGGQFQAQVFISTSGIHLVAVGPRGSVKLQCPGDLNDLNNHNTGILSFGLTQGTIVTDVSVVGFDISNCPTALLTFGDPSSTAKTKWIIANNTFHDNQFALATVFKVDDFVVNNTFYSNSKSAIQSQNDLEVNIAGNNIKGINAGTDAGINLLFDSRMIVLRNVVRNESVGIGGEFSTSNSLFAFNSTTGGGIGIFMGDQTSGNKIVDSVSLYNGNATACAAFAAAGSTEPCIDVVDDSKGSKTAGTANTYKDDRFGKTSPAALAKAAR